MAEKIKTSDYERLPIEKWNVTTFRAFMQAVHQDKYGIPYVANNHAVEGRMIKNMFTEYGRYETKRFIEKCFETYKPNSRYPGLNFGFMYSYMRERTLPMVLKEIAQEQLRAKRKQQAEQAQPQEIDTDWF